MPVSRHQKKKRKRRQKPRRIGIISPEPRGPYLLSVSKEQFENLRDNEDFINMVRLGRVLNALVFSWQIYLQRPDPKSSDYDRYYFRSIYLFGGYLFEAIRLFESLRSRYGTDPKFEKLLRIAYPTTDRRREKIVKTIRDGVGFHFDSDDQTVRPTLTTLDLPSYELFTFDRSAFAHVYVGISDTIDLNYLIDKLKGEANEADTLREIMETLITLTRDISEAATEFFVELVKRLDLDPFVTEKPNEAAS